LVARAYGISLIRMLATSDLLSLLRSREGKSVSGEELSKCLGVSRTAIWKHIHHLQDEGYDIEAVPNLGYRLISTPDRLVPDEIKAGLKSKRFGKKIFCYQQTSSTNDRAMELASDQLPEGTLITAEYQTRGRGRRERTWTSKKEANLLFSLLFRPPWISEQAQLLTLLMAVAVARSIREQTGLAAQIKWPNDVMVQDAKVSGILTEMQGQTDKIDFVVCGVGINVNSKPRGAVRTPAISLSEALRKPVGRIPLLQQILVEVEHLYQKAMASGSDSIVQAWQALSWLSGKAVTLKYPDGKQISGSVMGIDVTGALILKTDRAKTVRVVSGEIVRIKKIQ
jgi:BirA family transcriptional regulator, biotin operon repressor / biotin---[acetyl-CoA-carboxylase] ligase